MPNRIMRESICTSGSIDSLSWFEEILFYRLIVSCDDFGRYDGRAVIIKNKLFPLKENLTLKTVENALHGLASAGLVVLYTSQDRRFLYLPTWGKYQHRRAKESKYPDPLQASESICTQMQANVPVFENRESRIENRESKYSAEPKTTPAPPVVELPLNDGDSYPVTQEQVAEWGSLYPAVDVMQQLRAMKGWLNANPAKRKTRRGILRFVNAWLSREQDRGRGAPAKPSEPVRKYNHDTGKWEIVEG